MKRSDVVSELSAVLQNISNRSQQKCEHKVHKILMMYLVILIQLRAAKLMLWPCIKG